MKSCLEIGEVNMNRMKAISSLAWMSFFLLFVLVSFGWAQPPSSVDSNTSGQERERIRENIETLRMWKLIDALDLTSDQSTSFLPVLKELQDAKRSFHDIREELIRKLETASESEQPDEKTLKADLLSLENARKQFQTQLDDFFIKSSEILTLRQQVKLLIFEERFERRLREGIEQMRGGHKRRKESNP
jgi:Spy/CpxP family protein refolding chaperone